MVSNTYIESCEKRFGDLVDRLGFCAECPRREDVLEFMGEENPNAVPQRFVEMGRLAEEGCKMNGGQEMPQSPCSTQQAPSNT